jgi:hypothetical protein
MTSCAEKWKAAQADNHQGVVMRWDQTGIFSSVCRHGLVALVTDMRQSGELYVRNRWILRLSLTSSRSKYPLAILERLVAAYGERLLIAYDIGCRFKTTAANSSLGPHLKEMGTKFIVPAFHGWAHNRLCQNGNHPLYFRGVGLEEFETAERLFSMLNQCAGSVRHSSHFHREQVLHMQLQRNDREKYAQLGMSYQELPSSPLTIML